MQFLFRQEIWISWSDVYILEHEHYESACLTRIQFVSSDVYGNSSLKDPLENYRYDSLKVSYLHIQILTINIFSGGIRFSFLSLT